MAKAETKHTSESTVPAYVPWKSLDNYVGGLKKTGTVPHTLDSSVKPSTMSGGLWRSLVAGFKFLGLIEPDGKARDSFHKLVKAHGTSDWPNAVKVNLLPAYSAITSGLPLENATSSQLDKRFREIGNVDGQMLRKSERFFLYVLRESGTKYSTLFSMRRETPGGNGKRKRTQKPKPKFKKSTDRHLTDQDGLDPPPQGTIDFPIPIGDTHSYIRVPRSITTQQIGMVKAIYDAVEALAKQNSAQEENK